METSIAFRPEFLDFDRGIRVGNLEDNERITRILKLALESRFAQPFVTERWGRGVYWQWIGFLPRANREAKPRSSAVSFGCSKYFITVDQDKRRFLCGMQVERGYEETARDSRAWQLGDDWDWHRLLAALKRGGALESEFKRLLSEGFQLQAGSWESGLEVVTRAESAGATKLRRLLAAAPKREWVGLQFFYPMSEAEVGSSSGPDLVEAMLAVFDEVTPAMNLCMQIRLERSQSAR